MESGRCRAIGVSNFSPRRLKEFIDQSDTPPSVNQVEYNVFCQQRELADYCRQKKIPVQAYSPLARCRRLGHPVLRSIAAQHGKSKTQMMLLWCLQQTIPVIPKSSQPERIRQNAEPFDFELTDSEMKLLSALNEDFHASSWRPTNDY